MPISKFERVILLSVIAAAFTTPAWCGRADKGGSTYGVNTAACPSGSGPQNSTGFGALTATCFGPGSGQAGVTLFQLTNNSSPFPSTVDVLVDFAQPTTIDYGLLVCDNFGSIPCVNQGADAGPLNPVNFAGAPSFGSSSALFTFSNFTGQLDFYVNETATIASVTPASGSSTPEPRSTAAVGLLLLASFSLMRRFVAKPRRAAAQI